MNIRELKESKFLKKEDVGQGKLVTIEACFETNVAKEGAPPEMKWALKFAELEKAMILNSTNGQIISGILHSEESDDWVNGKIVVYEDPNINFGGKVVGGIRVRAPKYPKPAAPPAAASAAPRGAPRPVPPRPVAPPPLEPIAPGTDDVPDDDVPF